jgi:hypothetical protein
MKVNCTQCGAEHLVMESDFFLRCPFCDARIVVSFPSGTPAMVKASVSDEYVRRLFPPGMVLSLKLLYFPYIETGSGSSRDLVPCFSQPWQELDSYRPPDGDRVVFDESMAEPGEIMPFDRDMLDRAEGRLVLHPFFVVMLKLPGYSEGMLVDGVSGNPLGDIPSEQEETSDGKSLDRLFFKALLAGLLVSIPLYLLSSTIDLARLPRVWFNIAMVVLIGALFFLRGRRE